MTDETKEEYKSWRLLFEAPQEVAEIIEEYVISLKNTQKINLEDLK